MFLSIAARYVPHEISARSSVWGWQKYRNSPSINVSQAVMVFDKRLPNCRRTRIVHLKPFCWVMLISSSRSMAVSCLVKEYIWCGSQKGQWLSEIFRWLQMLLSVVSIARQYCSILEWPGPSWPKEPLRSTPWDPRRGYQRRSCHKNVDLSGGLDGSNARLVHYE